MSSALYLEHYLDSLEHLPIELQRNFKLMRDLDTRAQLLMKDIDSLANNYLTSQKTLSQDDQKQKLDKIQNFFNKAKEYGDDKVQLAIQTYELVDKHIRRLDTDLARFESEIQDKALSSRNQDEPAVGKRRKKLKDSKGEKKKRSGNSSEEDSTGAVKSSKKKKQKGTGNASTSGNSTSNNDKNTTSEVADASFGIAHPGDVLDMPVDPNEPTYCLCHQVSYGEMIGCDNSDCPIEWFHFACVGLTTKPKGKWYCPKCIQDRKKK
ncbi:inhibitor of growth protein 5 isoform X2 [Atheta coriaria]|uniref:inhibitor of growth protein 5 isoform X2 n=1 Tax=Dalotia coriaria TaxID=877792 RepID=UPI0031F34F0E